MFKKFALGCALGIVVVGTAWSGNGHMLHGIGAVNSSMGGAGASLLTDPVSALMWNPALIMESQGNLITFSTEFFDDGVEIVTTLDGPPQQVGVTRPSNQIGVLPAFGWTSHDPNSKWGFGFGLLAIAGFRTDYAEDPDSLLFPAAPNGFGRIYTDSRVTKIPFALAYQATPKLALGASLNVYLGELAIAPLPHVVRDENGAGDIFYPQGGNLVNEFTYSIQVGVQYQATERVSIGGSVTTKQHFDNYEWNSTFADPGAANFGQHRPLDFDLDGPLMATVGTGIKLNDKVRIAVDAMYLKYEGVAGYGSPGGIIDGVVYPFGWRDVYVGKAGIEYTPNDKLTLRGGYNHGNTPLKSRLVLTATGAPSTFQKHYTGGIGVRITDKVSADLGFYIVPREHVKGPLPDIDGNVIGSLDTSNKLTSALVGLRWEM